MTCRKCSGAGDGCDICNGTGHVRITQEEMDSFAELYSSALTRIEPLSEKKSKGGKK